MGADSELAGLIASFARDGDPERGREALNAVETVPAGDAVEPWLALLAALDRHLDADWDASAGPELVVQPPASEGIVYPAGSDPAALKDPVARAAYERAIAENDARTRRYDEQMRLHRLEERALEGVARAIEAAPADGRDALERSIRDAHVGEARKRALVALLPKRGER